MKLLLKTWTLTLVSRYNLEIAISAITSRRVLWLCTTANVWQKQGRSTITLSLNRGSYLQYQRAMSGEIMKMVGANEALWAMLLEFYFYCISRRQFECGLRLCKGLSRRADEQVVLLLPGMSDSNSPRWSDACWPGRNPNEDLAWRRTRPHLMNDAWWRISLDVVDGRSWYVVWFLFSKELGYWFG